MIFDPGRLEEAHRTGEGVSWKQDCEAAQLYEIMTDGRVREAGGVEQAAFIHSQHKS